MAPPQAVKDKHVRLRVAPAVERRTARGFHSPLPSRRGGSFRYETGQAAAQHISSWRDNIAFKAMGWGMKESCDRLQLLAGDRLDIAYSLGMNDHPEFGGLELTLRDVVRAR